MKAVVFINIPEDAYKTNFIYQKLQAAALQNGLNLSIEVEGFDSGAELTNEEISNSRVVVVISDSEYSKERFAGRPIFKLTSDEALRDIEKIYSLANKAQELSEVKIY